MKRILALALCIMIVFSGVVFAAGDFSDVIEVTSSVFSLPSNGVKSPVSVGEVSGNTNTNIINNGIFDDGTNDWTPGSSTLSVSNNTLSITSNGATYFPQSSQITNVPIIVGKKLYVKARIRVTNSNCLWLRLYLRGSVTEGTRQYAINQSPPIENNWYDVSAIITIPSDAAGYVRIMLEHTYADAATANGKTMEVQEITVVDLTAEGLDSLTADECNARWNWFDSTKSTNSVLVKSVGKNLFGDSLELGAYSSVGAKISDANVLRSVGKTRIKPSTTYKLSSDLGYTFSASTYDLSGNFISRAFGITSFTTESNAAYVAIATTVSGQNNLDVKIQLEEGSIATSYAKYEKSEVYFNGKLNSIQDVNGNITTRDKVDFSSGVYTQNTNKVIVQSADITSLNTSNGGYDIVQIDGVSELDHIINVSTKANIYTADGYNITIYGTATPNTWYQSTGKLRIVVAKGQYSSLADAQAKLTGTTLIYQLATPTTEQQSIPPLIAYSNGTISIEPVVQDVGIYNNGITITNTDLPIKSIESVTKIEYDEYGNRKLTTIAPSMISHTNGITITITGASKDDMYEYVYHYDNSLTTMPTMKYSVAVTQEGAISGNTDAIQKNGELIETILQQIEELMNMVQ